MKMDKKTEYCALILTKIGEMFEEDENLLKDISDGDNCTDFFHALANMVTTNLYNQLTSGDLNMLQFNHIANQLVFQNSNRVDNK